MYGEKAPRESLLKISYRITLCFKNSVGRQILSRTPDARAAREPASLKRGKHADGPESPRWKRRYRAARGGARPAQMNFPGPASNPALAQVRKPARETNQAAVQSLPAYTPTHRHTSKTPQRTQIFPCHYLPKTKRATTLMLEETQVFSLPYYRTPRLTEFRFKCLQSVRTDPQMAGSRGTLG